MSCCRKKDCIHANQLPVVEDADYYIVTKDDELGLFLWEWETQFVLCDEVVECVENGSLVLEWDYDFTNATVTLPDASVTTIIENEDYELTGAWDFSNATVTWLDIDSDFWCAEVRQCIEWWSYTLTWTWDFSNATLSGLGILDCGGVSDCLEQWNYTLEWTWDFTNASIIGIDDALTFWCDDVKNCVESWVYDLQWTYDFNNATVLWLFDCTDVTDCLATGNVNIEGTRDFSNASSLSLYKHEPQKTIGYWTWTSEGKTNIYGNKWTITLDESMGVKPTHIRFKMFAHDRIDTDSEASRFVRTNLISEWFAQTDPWNYDWVSPSWWYANCISYWETIPTTFTWKVLQAETKFYDGVSSVNLADGDIRVRIDDTTTDIREDEIDIEIQENSLNGYWAWPDPSEQVFTILVEVFYDLRYHN